MASVFVRDCIIETTFLTILRDTEGDTHQCDSFFNTSRTSFIMRCFRRRANAIHKVWEMIQQKHPKLLVIVLVMLMHGHQETPPAFINTECDMEISKGAGGEYKII